MASPRRPVCIKANLSGTKNPALDGVNLAYELAVPRQCDVFALKENLQVRCPTLLAIAGKDLQHNLWIVSGEIHADATLVDG